MCYHKSVKILSGLRLRQRGAQLLPVRGCWFSPGDGAKGICTFSCVDSCSRRCAQAPVSRGSCRQGPGAGAGTRGRASLHVSRLPSRNTGGGVVPPLKHEHSRVTRFFFTSAEWALCRSVGLGQSAARPYLQQVQLLRGLFYRNIINKRSIRSSPGGS